ncbi:alkane hydroxylase MAH1-like [Iris pallida]|uniref:noroxomaritidine synthase n=1 Tax=Iris pallida TaxID=29817 RepID=A0AAX6FLH4_IRIPA|nr:alkane hydroxylase MAH1-like [Iris pallida]
MIDHLQATMASSSSSSSLLLDVLLHSYTTSTFLSAYACFFFFLYLYWILNKRSSSMPTNWPLVGMLPDVLYNLDNVHDWLTDFLRECGCTYYFRGPRFVRMNALLTCDPANVNHIFNVNFANYPKGRKFSEMFDVLGDGIFNSDGESWRTQRRKAQVLTAHPQFRSLVARSSRDKVENGLVPLLGRLADRDAVVDLQDVFLRLTFDMTCSLVFGVDPGCLSPEFPTVPFSRAMDDAMEAVFSRHAVPRPCWKLMKRLGIGKEKKLAAAWEVMDKFVADSLDIIKSRKEEDKYEGCLLTSYNIDGTDDQREFKFLRDTMVNFMVAGRDTTAAGLTWFFWLLSKNPTAESRILEELDEHLVHRDWSEAQAAQRSSSARPISFDAEGLAKLVYLHAALCEALRLYPPVPFEQKEAARPDVLPSGHRVPAGGKIIFSAYSMGRMEGVWGKDCMEFRPERWISERGRLRHEPSYKFLSFNCGPRTCVGKDVAFTQMKAVVAAVVCNFRVEPVQGQAVEPKHSIILHMRNGWKVRIKKKTH